MTWHRDESHTALRLRGGAQNVVPNGASGGVPSGARDQGASETVSRVNGRRSPRLTGVAQKRDQTHPDHPNREHEGYLIKELQQLLRTQIEARIRAKGLWTSFPHSAVLMALNVEPGLSGAQLARRNSVTAQTMNGLLMPLEAKGLIDRRPDPENARILRCYLKPKGVLVLQLGMHEAGAVFDQMLGRLSSRERVQFRRILRRCIGALHSNTRAGMRETSANERSAAARRKSAVKN